MEIVDILKGFDLVGITEKLYDFIEAIVGKLEQEPDDKHVQDYESWEFPLTVEMIPDIIEANRWDYRLYYMFAPSVIPIPIEQASTMTIEKLRRYYILNKPCLIKNAASLLFDNYQNFSEAYIREHWDPDMIIEASTNTGRLLFADLNTTLPKCMDSPTRCVYFDKIEFNRLHGTLFSEDQDDLRRNLFRGIKKDTFAWSGDIEGRYDIYISKHGGALPHSHSQRLNMVFEGKKRWILVNPMTYPTMEDLIQFELSRETGVGHWKKWREYHGMPIFSSYLNTAWFDDVVNQGHIKWPHYDFIQEGGDLFFLPSYYTHGTTDITNLTIGIILRDQIVQFGTNGLNVPHHNTKGIRPDEDFGGLELFKI